MGRSKSAASHKIGAADRERGRRILALRKARNESQAAFGDLFGVEQATVSRWEEGSPVTRAHWGQMAELAGQSPAEFFLGARRQVPLLSWISAGKLANSESQIPVDDVPTLGFSDLGDGDFFALKVVGDSMDRISPEGSIIVVDRADNHLVSDRAYVFGLRGEATYKLWAPDPPHLAPYSTNPANRPIFVKDKGFTVIGRVRRTLLDL